MLLHAATPAGIHQPDENCWAGWEGTSRLGDWRITDWSGLEGTLKDPPVQLPAMARDIFH